MKTHLPEDTIQKEVVKFFTALETSSGGFSFFAVIGGSVRVPIHIGKRMKEMGARAGVHDMVFLIPDNKAVFIELKSMIGRLEPPQRKWDAIITGLGFASYCVKGMTGDEVICRILDILESHGLAEGTKRPVTLGEIARKHVLSERGVRG